MKRTNRTLFIHNTARGRIKFLLLALFAFQGLQAQKLFPAPSAIETHKGTFSYDEVSAKCVRTTISKSLPAIGIEHSDEAYQLEITPDSIFIDATSAKGAFYARQAIKQLARHERGKIRCCRIYSSPRYAWRGFMLDESRHFFGKEKVKQYLDLMALLHLNVFHWHLTDEPGWRIEIKKYPKLTKIGAVGNWHDAQATIHRTIYERLWLMRPNARLWWFLSSICPDMPQRSAALIPKYRAEEKDAGSISHSILAKKKLIVLSAMYSMK